MKIKELKKLISHLEDDAEVIFHTETPETFVCIEGETINETVKSKLVDSVDTDLDKNTVTFYTTV